MLPQAETGGTSILNGQQVTTEALLTAIGGEMVPRREKEADRVHPLNDFVAAIESIPPLLAILIVAIVIALFMNRRER